MLNQKIFSMSWDKVKLGDIAETSSGGTPGRTSTEYWKGGTIPWVKSGELKDCLIINAEEFITEAGLKKSSAKLFKEGTLLIALYGATAGRLGFLGLNAATNQAVCSIIPKYDNLNKKYLYYYLLFIREKIISESTGGAQPNISQNYVKELAIPLPPLHIQQHIADVLDKADALRQKDQLLLRKYDELAQSIFYDMFGDPVQNEMGWEMKKLKEISTKIHSGNTPKGGSNVYIKKGITFFRSQNVWKNRLEYEDIAFIDELTHKSMNNSSLKKGDILMTKTGRINTENSSLGRAALYLGEDDRANINGHVYLIRLQKNLVNEFVLHILTTNEYRNLIREVCVGGIDKRQLNKEHIEEFPIIFPPLSFQLKFAEMKNNLSIQKSASLTNKSNELFNSLMNEYFS